MNGYRIVKRIALALFCNYEKEETLFFKYNWISVKFIELCNAVQPPFPCRGLSVFTLHCKSSSDVSFEGGGVSLKEPPPYPSLRSFPAAAHFPSTARRFFYRSTRTLSSEYYSQLGRAPPSSDLPVSYLPHRFFYTDAMSNFEVPSEIDLDLGNLAAFDRRQHLPGSDIEKATNAAEALVRAIFSLPRQSTEDGKLVSLPKPTFELPREKPIPKERQLTKWEQFAKEKGIQKKRRDRLVLDEATGEYVPRYGRGSKNDLDRQVIIPHKESMPDNVDPFAMKRAEKKKRKLENTKQNLRNNRKVQRAKVSSLSPMQALDVASTGPSGKKFIPKKALKDSLAVAQKATASAGKFDKKLAKEPKQKSQGRKKKFETVSNKKTRSKERELSQKIADRVLLGKQ